MNKTCPICGRTFFAKCESKIFCSDRCKRISYGPQKKKKRTSEPTFETTARDPVKDCPNDCRYLSSGGAMRCCVYILKTGVKRGCPGGKHCERYRAS